MPHVYYILITSFCTIVFAYYSFLLIQAYVGLKNCVPKRTPYVYQPSVSIIVPFRDEATNLRQLLKDLAKQFYPNTSFELILINDRSSELELDFVKKHVSRTSVRNIRLLQNPGLGKKTALAYGVAKANTQIILQTDADCRLPEDWISEMVQPFTNIHTKLVLGPVSMQPENSFWSGFAALDFLSLQAIGLGTAQNGNAFMGSAANLAYRKETWLANNDKEHKELSGDDTYLIQSLAAKDATALAIAGLQNALVKTAAPKDLKAFVNQRVRWGSKTKNYKSLRAKLVAIDVFLLNFGLIILALASIIDASYTPFLLTFFLSKAIIDFGIMYLFATAIQQRGTLKNYVIHAFIYPFYIVITTFIIVFFPDWATWKGQKLTNEVKS